MVRLHIEVALIQVESVWERQLGILAFVSGSAQVCVLVIRVSGHYTMGTWRSRELERSTLGLVGQEVYTILLRSLV